MIECPDCGGDGCETCENEGYLTCSFPDCGCYEARVCMMGEPSSAALTFIPHRGKFPRLDPYKP